MAFTPEKRKYLQQAGLDDAAIKELEGNIANKAQAAESAGLEKKEVDPATPPADTPADAPVYASQTEVAEVLTQVTQALTAITARLDTMAADVKALQTSDEAKIAKAAAATPRASLQALIEANIVGNPAAVVDGRTALAKAGPKQAPAETVPQVTASPLLNHFMAQTRGAA